MFQYHYTIKIHEADAAGILFFANYLKLAHDAYETLMQTHGLSLGKLLNHTSYLLVIAHAEMDYKHSLQTGDNIRIDVNVRKIGNSSFTLGYEIFKETHENKNNEKSIMTACGETVHVCIDRNSNEKIPLPDPVINILKQIS